MGVGPTNAACAPSTATIDVHSIVVKMEFALTMTSQLPVF